MSNKSKLRRPNKSYRLQNQDDESNVLEWVEENPCLWNTQNKDFKNKSKKDRLWSDKASELGYDVESLKSWYISLRDWNTRLLAQRSGDGAKQPTEREEWVMNGFAFLKSTVRHRRAPVKSVKEAITIAQGDLEEAERIAAEDEVAIDVVDGDLDDEASTTSSKTKRRKRDTEDSTLSDIRNKLKDAQTEMISVKNVLSAAEPVSERSTFRDWVRQVCKDASDDQYSEFQMAFITLHTKWKSEERQQLQQQRSRVYTSSSSSACQPASFERFQPLPNQWRIPPPHLQGVSPWQSQSQEYMQSYIQQPLQNPPASQQCQPQQQFHQQWASSPSQPPDTVMAIYRPITCTSTTASTSGAETTTLFNLDSQSPVFPSEEQKTFNLLCNK